MKIVGKCRNMRQKKKQDFRAGGMILFQVKGVSKLINDSKATLKLNVSGIKIQTRKFIPKT